MKFEKYTESYKPKAKSDIWQKAVKLFEEKNYFESYKNFFEYLIDDERNNLNYELKDGRLSFNLIQGSKLITGEFDGSKIKAHSKVATYEKNSIPAFRQLLEQNYTMNYSRFAVSDNSIFVKFDSSVLDCSPEKLYFGLKELAVRADKQDDMLVSKFKTLRNEETKSEILSENEFLTYKKYFFQWLHDAFTITNTLDRDKYSGAFSFVYLNAIFKIDFFLSPKGIVENDIEEIVWNYYDNKNMQYLQKLEIIEEKFKTFLTCEDNALRNTFYNTRYTFSLQSAVEKNSVNDIINKSLDAQKWYFENNFPNIAFIILEYSLGFVLYFYGMQKSLRNLISLLYQIINYNFANEISGQKEYVDNNIINKENVEKSIDEIINTDIEEYPRLKFYKQHLDYSDMFKFTKTFLEEITKLNYKNKQ